MGGCLGKRPFFRRKLGIQSALSETKEKSTNRIGEKGKNAGVYEIKMDFNGQK